MTAKYKVFLGIEKIDPEDEWCPTDLEAEFENIGPEFDTLEKAQFLKERLVDAVTNDGYDDEVIESPILTNKYLDVTYE